MFLSLARVSKLAFQQFHRNLWLSVVTITLLVLPLLAIHLVVGLGAVAEAATLAIQDKIDISIYFKPTVTNEAAISARESLLMLPEVKKVAFIPREESLARFKDRHQDDPIILESLKELSDNPFGAALAVTAHNPEKYQPILEFLADPKYTEMVEEKNFDDHRLVVDKINALMRNIRSFGLIVAGIFGVIAILIVINTVRVAVYTHRGEIGIMRLVGAGNWFIRGPFLLEAVIFSAVSVVLAGALIYPSILFIEPRLALMFSDVPPFLMAYYRAHFLVIFGGQFVGVLFLTIVSSFLAVRRYLHV